MTWSWLTSSLLTHWLRSICVSVSSYLCFILFHSRDTCVVLVNFCLCMRHVRAHQRRQWHFIVNLHINAIDFFTHRMLAHVNCALWFKYSCFSCVFGWKSLPDWMLFENAFALFGFSNDNIWYGLKLYSR